MQTCRGRFFKDSIFFFQVFAVVIELFFLNGFRTLIFLDAVTREDLNVNHGALGARWNT